DAVDKLREADRHEIDTALIADRKQVGLPVEQLLDNPGDVGALAVFQGLVEVFQGQARQARQVPRDDAGLLVEPELPLPATDAELLAGPREVFDSIAELLDAGWRVD